MTAILNFILVHDPDYVKIIAVSSRTFPPPAAAIMIRPDRDQSTRGDWSCPGIQMPESIFPFGVKYLQKRQKQVDWDVAAAAVVVVAVVVAVAGVVVTVGDVVVALFCDNNIL